MIKQGIGSTTSKPTLPKPRTPCTKDHEVGVYSVPIDDLKNMIGTDLPRRYYPVTSARGHKYLFLLYDYNTNYIAVKPIKSRKASDLLQGFEQCYTQLQEAGLTATILRLDNETSKTFINHVKTEGLQYQFAAPGDHCVNPAERAIQTCKEHFISILSGTDPSYPDNCWDLLLEQAELTLNLLRPSCMQPNLSAYAQLKGQFVF